MRASRLPLFLVILLGASCEIPVAPDAELLEVVSPATQTNGKSVNPFEAHNMKTAINNVAARVGRNGRSMTSLADLPSTTHNYVRFSPQNEDHLLELHNRGYDLYDVPLDQEIVTQGEYYEDPTLPPGKITYLYSLVPANYSLPTSMPYHVISQVFLFNEDAGDEQDPESDPWIPDPPPDGYCYDEWGQAYICDSDPRLYIRTSGALPEDLYIKATKQLRQSGIGLVAVYNEAMRLAGLPEEIIDENAGGGRTQSVRYFPSGTITVADNTSGGVVPVKNVKVKSRRWFKLGEAQTDANGAFQINKGYRQKANVVLAFQNSYATVRGINGAGKLWEYSKVLEKELGQFQGSALQSINVSLPYSSNADSYVAIQWAAAHCLNTLQDTRQYSTSYGITAPYFPMNIWISSAWTTGASTPMLRAIVNTSIVNQAIDYLLLYNVVGNWSSAGTGGQYSLGSPIGLFVKKVLENYLPDVTLRLQNANNVTRASADLNGTFFHEFGHSQHYVYAGNNYWASYIGYIVANSGYGSKSTSGSGRIAVGEAWGYFVGPTFTRIRYSSNQTVSQGRLDFLEKQRNDNTLPFADYSSSLGYSRGWIPWGALHDLTDTGEPSITLINDQVVGYSISGVFRGYQGQGSTTIPALRDAILALNGNSQSTQVTQLFSSYGW